MSEAVEWDDDLEELEPLGNPARATQTKEPSHSSSGEPRQGVSADYPSAAG